MDTRLESSSSSRFNSSLIFKVTWHNREVTCPMERVRDHVIFLDLMLLPVSRFKGGMIPPVGLPIACFTRLSLLRCFMTVMWFEAICNCHVVWGYVTVLFGTMTVLFGAVTVLLFRAKIVVMFGAMTVVLFGAMTVLFKAVTVMSLNADWNVIWC